MSNFINFSLTVTILWTKLSRMAQRGNLAGASGVIWPARSGLLYWISRVAKRVVPSWLGSQPLAVTLRHNLPSRGWFTLQKSLLIWLSVSSHVVKRRGSAWIFTLAKMRLWWSCNPVRIPMKTTLCDATLLSFQKFARIKLRVAPTVRNKM